MTEILELMREKNRARQARYYEKNKETHNEKRRALYKIGRGVLKSDKPVEPQPETFISNEIDLSGEKELSYDDVMIHLAEVIEKQSTLAKYKQDFKRLIMITECDNIIKCLKHPKKIISQIEEGRKSDDTPYSINTKKSLYQTILFLISHFKLNVSSSNIKILMKKFEEYKVLSSDYTKLVSEEKEIISFHSYIEKVKEHFGINSKMYVLTLLYNDITLRDDFVLKIINKKEEATDDSKNYIILPAKGNLKLIINSYKTNSKYGVINHTLTSTLSKIIRTYIETHAIENYLFGNKKLTSFVSTNNKEMGISGGINEMRHMKITDELQNVSAEMRVTLAEKMKHSPATQLSYLRKMKMV